MPAEGRPPVCTGCSFTCRWADREKHFSKSQISGRKANPERCRACTRQPTPGYTRPGLAAPPGNPGAEAAPQAAQQAAPQPEPRAQAEAARAEAARGEAQAEAARAEAARGEAEAAMQKATAAEAAQELEVG